MSKTLGLALGSGGSRGVAHVGFLRALEEADIKPDFIAGCSMGSVVGACYASGMPAIKMKDVLLKMKMRDLVDVSPAVVTKLSFLRSKKMETLLKEYLGGKKIEDLEIPFRCVATELYSGQLHVFSEGDVALAVQASSTIPTVFRPVRKDGKMFVDGGCLCRVPVEIVKDMGADVVVAVDVLKNAAEPVESVSNIVKMVLRIFDIMDTHMTEHHRKEEGEMCDLLIEPDMHGMSQYEFKHLAMAYKAGYDAGKANVQKIKELIK